MNALAAPWIEFAILLPLVGAGWVRTRRNPDESRLHCLLIAGLTLLCTLGAWWEFSRLDVSAAHDRWWLPALGEQILVIDELSAPLMPLAALVHLLTALATLRAKSPRFSFPSLLLSEAILLGMLSSESSWAIIVLLAVSTLPPWFELRARDKPTRVYVLHMGTFVATLVAGGWLVIGADQPPLAGVALLLFAVLLRSGIVPTHCWMTDLFEHATLGTALLFVTPMAGAYAAVRLALPVAPDWALRAVAVVSLITAVYSAGMSLVQREARRFFCYLFLSHSSLVLVGLETVTAIGLTGALCAWLSAGVGLAGFGLTLRSLESRLGRLSLDDYHGMYDHTPLLAALFLLTGLASVGFPGTIGFVAMELLVDGAVQVYPHVGVLVVIASALNGIAVLHVYFRLFTGARHPTSIPMGCRVSEQVAVLTLTLLVVGGGLYPQLGVASRYHAATQLMAARREPAEPLPPVHSPAPHDQTSVPFPVESAP